MDEPLTIYVLAAGNERGGATSHLLTLAGAVRNAQLTEHIEFVLVGRGYLHDKLESVTDSLMVLDGSPLKAMAQLKALLRNTSGPCIVHAHGPRLNVLAWRAARAAKRPWTSTIHSNIYMDFLASRFKSLIFTRLNGYCLKRTVGLFVVNKRFADFLPNLPIRFVPNSVDLQPLPFDKAHYERELRHSLGLPPETKLIGIAARFDPVKDISTIIRAVGHIDDPNVHLAIAGDGQERASLQTLTDSLNVTSRVHFLGYVEHVRSFYAGLDVHVLSSISEGTPTSLLEAGYYGVPNIGTDIPGITQLITHEKTGLCFPVKDAVSLAAALNELLTDKDRAERMVHQFANEVLPRFTPAKMLEAYLAGYHQFLGSPKVTEKTV